MKNNPSYAEEVKNQIKCIEAMHDAYKDMVSEDGSQYMTITLTESTGKFQIQIQGLAQKAIDEEDMNREKFFDEILKE